MTGIKMIEFEDVSWLRLGGIFLLLADKTMPQIPFAKMYRASQSSGSRLCVIT